MLSAQNKQIFIRAVYFTRSTYALLGRTTSVLTILSLYDCDNPFITVLILYKPRPNPNAEDCNPRPI
jgi:hypothetical protein